jgi:hypothetical protein
MSIIFVDGFDKYEWEGITETTSVYKVQCKTWKVAQNLAGDFRNCNPIQENFNAPFCLRLLPAYRTEATKEFRNLVAEKVRYLRKIGLM